MHLPPGEIITSPNRTYTIVDHLATGDFSELYLADSPDGRVALKVGTGPDGDDRVADEALTLARLRSEGDDRLQPFLPAMHDAFTWDVTWVNAFEYLDGWYTLRQVHDRYPELDPKDMAWMFRRILAVAGFATRCHVEHGRIGSDHVLIQPEDHGLKLVGWTHSKPTADPSSSLNVMQAVQCGVYLLGGDPAKGTLPLSAPREFRAFFTGAQNHTDPWVLLKHFDELVERMWGRRRFHAFSMT